MINTFKITCCLVSVIGIALAAPSAVELNDDFEQCTKSDPKVGECLKNTLQSVLPNLVNGVPSIGLSPIDPLHITSLKIDHGTGPINIKLNFSDLLISNIGTAKINEVYADLDNNNFTLDMGFEKSIKLDGNYDVKGKVMILPIFGNGKGNISLDNLGVKMHVHLNTVERYENTFMEIQELTLNFTTSRMHINLDNLFNGDKVLENNMNTFLNENWKDIFDQLRSSFENSLTTFITEVGQDVFNSVPLNQIYID